MAAKRKPTARDKYTHHIGNWRLADFCPNISIFRTKTYPSQTNKIDRARFKKDYRTSIRRLIQESPQLEHYFNRNKTHYHKILRVYDEWENPEK